MSIHDVRRGVLFGALAALAFLPPPEAAAAQPGRLDLAAIQALPGRVVGQGVNRAPATDLRLLSFVLEEVTLPRPVLAPVDGRRAEVETVWRLTVTGEGFPVRAMPAVLLIDDQPVATGAESPDLTRLSFLIFNKRWLRHGASLALTYEGDLLVDSRDPELVVGEISLPAREGAQVFVLPETLNLDKE